MPGLMQPRRCVLVAFIWFGSILLTGCEWLLEPQFQRTQPRTDAEVAFAKSVLNELQEKSFVQDREFCGFIGLDEDGNYAATKAVRGEEDGCQPEEPDMQFDILASYHTHAAFSEGFDSERPSTIDLEADVEERIDGYISTPGGRLWFNDAVAQEARLLCGRSCLISDARYEPFDEVPLRSVYNLVQLRLRDAEVE